MVHPAYSQDTVRFRALSPVSGREGRGQDFNPAGLTEVRVPQPGPLEPLRSPAVHPGAGHGRL